VGELVLSPRCDLPTLSLVIPAYNEADSLRELHRQIVEACSGAGISAEILFVDDGSRDATWSIIQELAASSATPVKGLRFRRNFGKAAALKAGFAAAEGELFLMLDADLQDDPAEIPRLIAKLNEGYDVVNGWKQRRLDPWHKVYPSKVFNWLVSRGTGLTLHDHNCGLKLIRAEVTSELLLYGELHRFIAALAHANGFRVTELAVNHRPRVHGHSKYGFRRFQRGLLDLLTVMFLTSYGNRPQHLLGAIGLACFGLGGLGLGYLAIVWLLMHLFGAIPVAAIGGRPLLFYSGVLLLLGVQVLSLGLLAELIVAKFSQQREEKRVVERIGPGSSPSG
jgi:glycosyltransferase involved in cell wall biosynthesis